MWQKLLLTGASPVTTFLAVLRLKCSDTPCGYQEHSPTLLIPYPILSTESVDEKQILLLPIWYAHHRVSTDGVYVSGAVFVTDLILITKFALLVPYSINNTRS